MRTSPFMTSHLPVLILGIRWSNVTPRWENILAAVCSIEVMWRPGMSTQVNINVLFTPLGLTLNGVIL